MPAMPAGAGTNDHDWAEAEAAKAHRKIASRASTPMRVLLEAAVEVRWLNRLVAIVHFIVFLLEKFLVLRVAVHQVLVQASWFGLPEGRAGQLRRFAAIAEPTPDRPAAIRRNLETNAIPGCPRNRGALVGWWKAGPSPEAPQPPSTPPCRPRGHIPRANLELCATCE
jgi:hypothetical protein